jgi:hypothetical protein
VDRQEWNGPVHVFDRMDSNADGVLDADEMAHRRGRDRGRDMWTPVGPADTTGTAEVPPAPALGGDGQ